MNWTHTSHTISDPATEPVSRFELSEFGRFDDTSGVVGNMITGARSQIESMTNVTLIQRTAVTRWDDWPDKLYLPGWPVQSITSVQYYDSSNTLQTWDSANYISDTDSDPAVIQPAEGVSYPTIYDRNGAVIVTYVVGYGSSSDDVPDALRLAIMSAALDLYERRDFSTDLNLRTNRAVMNLIAGYKRVTVA